MNGKLFLLSRKIHRLSALVVAVLTLLMASTGLLMKYSGFSAKYLGFINLGMARYVHNSLSPYFAFALGLMVLTGLYMFFFTLPTRKKHNESHTPQV